jgi:hypothetical protein
VTKSRLVLFSLWITKKWRVAVFRILTGIWRGGFRSSDDQENVKIPVKEVGPQLEEKDLWFPEPALFDWFAEDIFKSPAELEWE